MFRALDPKHPMAELQQCRQRGLRLAVTYESGTEFIAVYRILQNWPVSWWRCERRFSKKSSGVGCYVTTRPRPPRRGLVVCLTLMVNPRYTRQIASLSEQLSMAAD